MSRLRRLVLSDRWFFITCRVLPPGSVLSASEFGLLARGIAERRAEHRFLLTAWVFLPDHWHAIFCPPFPLTIATVMESIKVAVTKRINRARCERGRLWQPRYFDRAVRTVREYHEKVEYIHLNPVRAGLVKRPGDWPWSSVHEYAGNFSDAPVTPSGLCLDRVGLPADQHTRI